MYNGYGGYGMGGMGAGGGSEMMIISLCCVCCVCIVLIFLGYWTNMFCKMGFGRSCQAETPTPTPVADSTATSDPSTYTSTSVNKCSEAWGKAVRGSKDPRPAIRPEYCQGESRAVGRDCYYWEVQADPVTGQGRWMRKVDPEDERLNIRYAGQCTPQVECPSFIDPKQLEGYSEVKPEALLKQCAVVTPSMNTEETTIKELTRQAKSVSDRWEDTKAWTDAHSRVWYTQMKRYIGQRDIKAYVANSARAATTLKKKMGRSTLKKSTFASMLEAAIRAPNNNADWIMDVTNRFTNNVRAYVASGKYSNTEAAYRAYLSTLVGRTPMVNWYITIDNPTLY